MREQRLKTGKSYTLVATSYLKKIEARLTGLWDYIHNAWAEIAITILGFISGVVVARCLGPSGRGQLSAAMMWPTYVGIIASIGLQQAFAYAIGAGWAGAERLQRLALKFSVFVGIPIMVIYWKVCPWLLSKQFPDQEWIPRIFSLFIPLTLYTGFLLPIYQGNGDFIRWNIGRLFRNGAWTLAIVILAAISALTVYSLLITQVAILFILAVFLYSQLNRIKERSKGEGTAPVRLIFKYGFAIYISGLAYTVNQYLDHLLLSLLVPPSELGQYAVATTLAAVILLIPNAVGPVVFSKIARAGDELSEQQHHMKVALFCTVMLLIPAGLFLMILAPWVTHILYGSAYAQAGQVLRVLAPAVIFLGTGYILSEFLRGVGKPMYATYGALVGAVITVGGLAWALPRFGIWGAAWVSLIAYAAMMIVQFFLLWGWTSKSRSAKSSTLSIQTQY